MHNHEHDSSIWMASLIFVCLGVVEFTIGSFTDSHVLIVLAMHNVLDGGMLVVNAQAEHWEHLPGFSRRRCQLAPLLAIWSSLIILLGAVYTGWISQGQETLVRPELALLLAITDIAVNQLLAKRLGHQHQHGGNRWAAKMHLYSDAAIGWIALAFLAAVNIGLITSDNLGGQLSSLCLVVISLWMIIASSLNYRRHLPRLDHIH